MKNFQISMFESAGVQLADAAFWAYDVGQGEGVPVMVGVWRFVAGRIGVDGRQLRPSSVEMSVPLGPTVIQVLVAGS